MPDLAFLIPCEVKLTRFRRQKVASWAGPIRADERVRRFENQAAAGLNVMAMPFMQ
jgi:hypothetical protein